MADDPEERLRTHEQLVEQEARARQARQPGMVPALPQAAADFGMPGAEAFGKLKSEWEGFLDQPGARTALLQFGINMMQPPSFGDTGMSQFGRAVGAAGGAVTRQMEEERKEREGEARGEAALMRGEAALTRSQLAQSRQETGTWREKASEESRKLQNLMSLRNAYSRYRQEEQRAFTERMKEWAKADIASRDLIEKGPPPGPKPTMPPIMSFPEFQEYQNTGVLPVPRQAAPAPAPGGTPTEPNVTIAPGQVTKPAGRPRAVNRETGKAVEWDGKNWVPVD